MNEFPSELLDRVIVADTLDYLRSLPDACVDAIITDPPYNLTALDFEAEIDWQTFWPEAWRVLNHDTSPVIVFSQQPFTTDLINSQRQYWRYEIVLEKTMPTGFLDAKRRPLRCHENIQVFGRKMPEYTAIMEDVVETKSSSVQKRSGSGAHYHKHERKSTYSWSGKRYPRSVWRFAQRHAFDGSDAYHPTQKPQAALERLMLLYTKLGDIVLDPFMGGGTTALAARATGRHFAGCDLSAEYVDIANKRLAQPYTLPMFEGGAS